MAMTPDGLILATGSGNAIEIASLAPGARESSKRQIFCEPMDFLSFSDDGRTLLATSSASRQRGSTVFSVTSAFGGPMTEDGMPIVLDVDQAWTTQILFPEKAPKAQQAVLLLDQPTGAVDRLFAFDSVNHSYGVYELANGTFSATRRILVEGPDNASEASAPPETKKCRVEDVPPAISSQKRYTAAAVVSDGTTEILVHRLRMYCGDDRSGHQRSEEQMEAPLSSHPLARIALFEGVRSGGICGLRWSMSSTLFNDACERLIAIGLARKASFLDDTSGGSTASRGRIFLLDFGVFGALGVPECLHDSETQTESIVIDLDTISVTENLPGQELAFEDEVNLRRGVQTRFTEGPPGILTEQPQLLVVATAAFQALEMQKEAGTETAPTG
ncbi:hypothetical protein H2199_008092 [Coniosporium tulheliwenetii]|uniref:Uncharacterized protein n=1 Tax=Coniosporium tulheliwenetii TaxID=3383036 RepID=A0ACC2YMC3_9PEZI|nr:hypothetical protein H2199_008092 [Cladosporium sp. JES 115]